MKPKQHLFVPFDFQVGFWKVRVEAQGQVNEKAIKVEKYYVPKFEVYVRMPTFVLDTDEFIVGGDRVWLSTNTTQSKS